MKISELRDYLNKYFEEGQNLDGEIEVEIIYQLSKHFITEGGSHKISNFELCEGSLMINITVPYPGN